MPSSIPPDIARELDEQYEVFCEFADAHGPQKAAHSLRRLKIPEEVIGRLVERFEHHIGQVMDHGGDEAYMQMGARFTWYTGPRPTDRCWPPLHDALAQSGWEKENLAALNDSSNTIVGLLDHPGTETFSTRGLVIGHVQSGKTTNFTSVMAKAADRGYRFFIVLSGIHNELRRQTQSRLVHDLVERNPEFWIQLTKPEHDFVPPANAAAYFSQHSQQPVVCVVKKNGPILRKLIRWLEDASLQLRSCPALVIDDEADQATVATKTINPLILRLLERLPKGAYVGYTATPFANLLIDPSSENLYPKDFIVDLPKPKEHFGTEVIFGREPLDHEDPEDVDDGYDMVREVPVKEIAAVRPLSRAEVDGFAPTIDGQIRKSVLWFWLATAARRIRGIGTPHSTMLIHTSVSVSVHESFVGPLEGLRTRTAQSLERHNEAFLDELREIWKYETRAVPADTFDERHVELDDVLARLPEVVADTRVILDNSRSEERLDYNGDPVTAIAVGGNTLSRGLTLEGLIVSYFVRSVSAYDTLLQMGRWFGYRRGYADLPRLWMTAELRKWFRHLATVEADLREDVRRYMTDGMTPLEFAVRIRAHPALRITQAAKMRDAVQAAAAYGGMRVQTRYFKVADEGWLRANQSAARKLVHVLRSDHYPYDGSRRGTHLWRGVPVDTVMAFLDAYGIHQDSMESDPRLLREYIRDRNSKSALQEWNVAIIGNPQAVVGTFDFHDELRVPKVVRARLSDTPDERADIKTLMSRRDAALDLNVPSAAALTESDIKRERRKQLPDTGLIVLYPIDARSDSARAKRSPLGAVIDVIGLGLIFPEPPPNEDSAVYFAADLSRVRAEAGYVEDEDLDPLESE